MRNSKFVRWDVILLGLVVLRTMAQNGFCPMCTKEYYIVPTRPKPFWGQFWGQICKTDSHTHQSNKCAALVLLRNADTYIAGFSQVKSPTNQYISFVLQQEVVRKPTLHHPRTPPLSPRETPRFGLIRSASAWCPAKYCPKIPAFRGFFISPQRHLPRPDFPVQVNPAQINN